MGKVMINAGGGGGVSSDELTATAGDVLKGKTAVTSDSNDEIITGTLELTGNAGTGDVVASKTFYTTNPKSKQTGTLADKNGTTQSATASLDNTNSRLQMTIPATGRYNTSSKLYTAFSSIASLIGLTAAKLANGQKVLGLTGTYKGLGNATAGQVLSGRTFSTASLSNATGTMPNNTGTPKAIQWVRLQNNRFEVAVDAGYYACGWADNSYEYLTYAQVRDTLGLTAAKLAQGQSVCGLTGTYKGLGNATAADVLSGKTFSTASLSNAKGTMGTMAGGTYTPSTSKQTISCSGKKMTSNITINAIPSTYIDMGSNGSWTVFNQGTFSGGFGFVPYYLNTSTMQQSDYSVIYENKTESNATNFDSDFNGETKYCVNVIRAIPQALVLNRAVNLTSLSRIRVEWYMYLPRNTSSDFNLLLINKNKQSISKTFYEDRTSAWSSRSFYVYSFISYDISDYSGEYFIGFQSNRSSVGISQIIFVK